MGKINFVVIEPDHDYDDSYKLEMYVDDIMVGYITYTEPMDVPWHDHEDVYEYYDEFYTLNILEIYSKYRNLGYGNLLLSEFVNNVLRFENSCVLEIGAFNVPSGEKSFYNNVVLPKFYESFGFNKFDDNKYFYDHKKQ